MKIPWVIVGGTGYDVEEIDNPQTRDMECPSCEKHVRFVEKELIKNLRLFGVPLVGVEKGRRVFECPRCQTCIEPPVEDPAVDIAHKQSAAAASLEAQLTRAQDEQWLWEKRADLASQNGDMDLAAEAMKLREKAARDVARLTTEVERARAKRNATAAAPVSAPARPAIVARAGAAGVEPTGADEFAALRARIARKQAHEAVEKKAPEASPTDERDSGEHERASADRSDAARGEAQTEADHDEGFAALKNRLAVKATEGEADAALRARERPMSDQAPAAKTVSPVAETTSIEDDFAALRHKLAASSPTAGERPTTDREAYEALKREIVEGPAPASTSSSTPAGATPGADARTDSSAAQPSSAPGTSGDDDDDPIAALKRKLRKR